MRAGIVAAAALIGGAALYFASQGEPEPEGEGSDWTDEAGGVLTGAYDTASTFIESATMGLLKISSMRAVTAADLSHPNVQALLRVIRVGEGTADPEGYRRLFGGGSFASFADHPRISVTRGRLTSTAAGAYQFLSSTWDETRSIMGLRDFSPTSQDWAAVGRIKARGALDDAKAGRFESALSKIAREWASMPGSPYGQPVISIERARAVYAMSGGDVITA